MVRCAVQRCSVTSYGIAKDRLPVKLHALPKDAVRRRKWLLFCGLKQSNDSLFICSNHFAKGDYNNMHDADIKRRSLKRDAVPSIRKPAPDPANLSERAKRMEKKSRSELVNQMLEQSEKEAAERNKIPHSLEEILKRNPVICGMSDLTSSDKSEHSNADPSNEIRIADSKVSDFFELTTFEPQLQSSLLHDEEPLCTPDEDPEFNMKLLCDAITVAESGKQQQNDTLYQTKRASDVDEGLTSSMSSNSTFEKIFESMVHVSKSNEEGSIKRGTVKRLQSIILHQRQTIKNLRMQLRGRDSQIKGLNTIIRQNDKRIEHLKSDNATLRKACDEMRDVPECVIQNRIRAAFLNFFSVNQTDLMLGLKKKVIWTPQEICKAFSLRYHSQPAYEIVRKDMKIPLPCLRSLREWASNIDMRKGVLEDVLKVLEIAGRYMERRERVTILGYDEMSVSETVERDKRNDDIVGPHKEMQIISARGLFAAWKQPIYVGFDQQMSIPILNDMITRLHAIGFQVVGNVHDCGGGNLSIWKDIGVDYEKEITHMKHPVTNDDVYFFPDPPHLLKLVRNWLLDNGFYYKGKLVTKKFLELLVEKASTLQKPLSKKDPQFKNVELNAMFKLSLKHIKVVGAERQNVRLAAELLSHTTAVNLRRHFGEYEEAMLLAEIIEKVNLWFDVMNSYQINQNVPSKKCYGMDLENQNRILDDMAEMIREIRTLKRQCLPKSSHLQIFQKAILVSITSVKKLLIMMRTQFDANCFIMTYKTNQDFIENNFAVLRLNGGTHDHPSPLQALDRLRLVFLGKNINQLKRHQNTQNNQIDEDYIMAKMLKKRKDCSNEAPKALNSIEDCSDNDEELEPWQFVPTERTLEEADGAEYVAGFMARGLKQNFPDLGNYTAELQNESENGLCSENYVQDLSYGGLIQPSDTWSNIYNQMDAFFNHIHNKTGPTTEEVGFRNTKDVQKRSIAMLKTQFPEIPDKIIKAYANKRINIRVRHMKKRLEEKKIHKHKIAKTKNRKGKENNADKEVQKERNAVLRKNLKKIKHITS